MDRRGALERRKRVPVLRSSFKTWFNLAKKTAAHTGSTKVVFMTSDFDEDNNNIVRYILVLMDVCTVWALRDDYEPQAFGRALGPFNEDNVDTENYVKLNRRYNSGDLTKSIGRIRRRDNWTDDEELPEWDIEPIYRRSPRLATKTKKLL